MLDKLFSVGWADLFVPAYSIAEMVVRARANGAERKHQFRQVRRATRAKDETESARRSVTPLKIDQVKNCVE